MNAVTIWIDDDDTVVDLDGQHYVIPLGAATLTKAELVSDPPRPEELTNAIGLVVDHLDDMVRELPAATEAETVAVVGHLAMVIAAVEFGGVPPLPFILRRQAAEEVFRTVATEPAAQRALNPGLPASAVGIIVGACCVVVGLMRYLHLDHVDIDEARSRP